MQPSLQQYKETDWFEGKLDVRGFPWVAKFVIFLQIGICVLNSRVLFLFRGLRVHCFVF